MQINGLAGFLRPTLFSQSPRDRDLNFNEFRDGLNRIDTRSGPSEVLLDSFTFASQRAPRVDDLSGPLAAFRLAEAGRFLTRRFQNTGFPAVDNFTDRPRFVQSQNDTLNQIRDRLETLRSTVAELRGDNAFNLRQAASSDPDLVEVTAGPDSPVADFTVRPQQRATGQVLASSTQSSEPLGLSGSFRLNGVQITLDATDTLVDLRNKINRGEDRNGNGNLDPAEDFNGNGLAEILSVPGNEFGNGFFRIEDQNGNGILEPTEDANNNGRLDGGTAETGVSASIQRDRLILTSLSGGSHSIDLQDDNGILQHLGFFTLNSKGQPVLNETQLDFTTNPAVDLNRTQTPARIEVNGNTVTSDSNTFDDVFKDTDLTLRQASDRDVLARVFIDAQTALNQIQTLFDQFNAAVVSLNDALTGSKTFPRDLEFQILRNDLTENLQSRVQENEDRTDNRETINANESNNGFLGISNINTEKNIVQEISVTRTVQAIRAGIQVPLAQTGNQLFQRLSAIGIRTANDDTFKIDAPELEQALVENPEEVLDLLTDEENGLLPQLERQLDFVLRENLGRLDLKQDLIQARTGEAPSVADSFRESEQNRILNLTFRNLIAVA